EEQRSHIKTRADRILQNKQLILQGIQREMEEETAGQVKFDEDFKNMKISYCGQEASRRNLRFSTLYQEIKMASRKWKKIERSLTSERGPWGHVSGQTIFWK